MTAVGPRAHPLHEKGYTRAPVMLSPPPLKPSAPARGLILGWLTCLSLILQQVSVPLHLALEQHCMAHEIGDCGEWHGDNHREHAHPSDHDHAHGHSHQSREAHCEAHGQERSGLSAHDHHPVGHHPTSGFGHGDDSHCPHSLSDHPVQFSALTHVRDHSLDPTPYWMESVVIPTCVYSLVSQWARALGERPPQRARPSAPPRAPPVIP